MKFENALKLYELQKDLQQYLGEEGYLNSHYITENGSPLLLDRNGENLSVKENEIRSPNVEESQNENEVHDPQSPIPEYAVSPHI